MIVPYSLIAAKNNNHVIGLNNRMPWHLPADLEHFKKNTMGKPIVMGRKTFTSIGRPLPGRRNIILTRNPDFHPKGTQVFLCLSDMVQHLQDQEEIMVIGGATLYQQFLPLATKLYITEIDDNSNGDTFFPEWDKTQWKLVESDSHQATSKNPYRYRFNTYIKKRTETMDSISSILNSD
jgi:dihydrofolate reductase